jgi:PTS system galactitol-specific IIB component
MRSIAVVCGAGVTVSTYLADRIRAHVRERELPVQVFQATVMDLLSQDFRADLIVSTVDLSTDLGIPVVSGMPLLLGTNPGQTFEDIERFFRSPTSGTPGGPARRH